jgi:hypothetical protein
MDWRAFGLLLLLSVVSAGCISYAARIHVSPPNVDRERLTHAEITEIANVVGNAAESFGARPNPKLAELRRTSEESEEYDEVIVADYVAERDRAHGRVFVTVGVNKVTGGVTVLIRDLDSFRSSTFTSSLENEIEKALVARFSTHAIDVERGAVGSDLGP